MDLRAGYRESTPPGGMPPATLVLPDACSDLIWQAGKGVSVAWPDTAPWQADLAPGSVLLGVRFAPGAGGPALRIPLDALQDRPPDRTVQAASRVLADRRTRVADACGHGRAQRAAAAPPVPQWVGDGPRRSKRIRRFRRLVAWTAAGPDPASDP